MSKKKNKKQKKDKLDKLYEKYKDELSEQETYYDEDFLKKSISSMEEYVNTVDGFLILDGMSVKKYKKALKVIKEACEMFSVGLGDVYIHKESYNELMEHQER